MDERRRRSTSQPSGRSQSQMRSSQRQASRRTSSNQSRRTASTPSRRNSRRKRRRKINLIWKILSVLAILMIVTVGAIFVIKYGPSKEQYDLDTYFGVTSDEQIAVIVDDEVIGAEAIKYDGHLYVSYDAVKDHINGRFYWDPTENILRYTLPTQVLSTGVGSKEYTIANETQSKEYAIVKTEGQKAYLALDFVWEYTDIEFQEYEDKGVKRVVIATDWGEKTTASIKRDTQVRLKGGVKSEVLTDVAKGEKVRVIEEVEDWRKVRTEDGFIGYVKKTAIKNQKTEKVASSREFTEPEFTSIQKDYTINMAWHQVTTQSANGTVLQTLANTKGLNTISPTWFTVADNDGNLTSIASQDYVNYAHQMGIEVWALVDNFGDNISQTELLGRTSSRDNLTNQLISAALQNGVDGINVDFEQIPTEAGDGYIQFIRELSVKCRLNHLILSVDNYVPKGYNSHYNRKEQGVMADYVIIMGYDEHYSGSYEAGSVASYNYVKEGIEETLKDVPAEKVINAMPFYTRLWKSVPKTDEEIAAQAGTEAANYPMKVTSEAMGMQAAMDIVNSAGVELTWDDVTKQNYASWTDAEGAEYQIWIEDAASLEAKLQLMKENHLAGTSAWKLGFETQDIWDLILKYVN